MGSSGSGGGGSLAAAAVAAVAEALVVVVVVMRLLSISISISLRATSRHDPHLDCVLMFGHNLGHEFWDMELNELVLVV